MVLALAMLWPMTSRLRAEAFNPERPCWNAMVLLLMKKCVWNTLEWIDLLGQQVLT